MGDTVHVKTKSGLEIDVDDAAGQDDELLAAALAVHAKDALGLPRLLRILLTEPARRALYDHVRRSGRVPYGALVDETVDIMAQLPGKKKVIALAGMLAADEDALVCDLAETYRIVDWRALPVRTVATLAVGLSEDSRVKMRLTGAKAPTSTLLTAAMIDRLSVLCWGQTKDAQHGRNRPKMMLDMLQADAPAKKTDGTTAYASAAEFEAARQRILKGGGDRGD